MTPNSTIFAPMTEQSIHLNSIEEAIEDIKAGKIIIVVDDENRENEGVLWPRPRKLPLK